MKGESYDHNGNPIKSTNPKSGLSRLRKQKLKLERPFIKKQEMDGGTLKDGTLESTGDYPG